MGVLAYAEEVNQSAFKEYETGSAAAMELIEAMKETHEREVKRCEEKLHLANMFECPRDMQTSQQVISAVGEMLGQYELLWKCAEESQMYTEEACEMLWVDINPGGLEENAKMLVQKIKKLPKVVKESDAYVGLERSAKDFYNTCPLIGSLRSPAMRDRHWQELMDVTRKEFELPDKDPTFRLRDILDLKLHEFTAQVEEITEKAGREAKHEETLVNLETTWSSIVFVMTLYKDTDVPLFRMQDEDVENLEADQLTLQGMVTSRYTHFRAKSQKWQDALAAVSDCNTLLGDIQRMWSYLEPLFMGSDEVKRELPEDTQRFVSIDRQVKQILRSAWKIQKVKEAFTQGGLLARLESLQADQEQCKKSLTDFLDGKRRVFPRFYFTSEADLLDILSNGSRPEKIMKHIDKVLLATKELTLEMAGPGQRPRAGYFIASVGVETVGFEPAVALEGKVEVYLQTVLSAQQTALKKTLKRSVERYPSQSRPEWLMNKSMQRPTDPAQIAILVAGIQTVVDVEKAMERIANGDAHAMPSFQDRQINDLKDLIKMTQQDLSKADRQRVMCMITLDAHTRDVITKLIREKAEFPTAFQWQSQLKQQYRDDDVSGGGVSDISICDARFDYGFEYLGNGPRLVVTPLTDRIYVTATQALWLKMGCAPAGRLP
jgi:dynein heavy chain, axonemal